MLTLHPAPKRAGAAVAERHIAQKTGAGQRALDQVVGQYATLGQRSVHRALEVCHAIDALAAVDALPGQIHPQGGCVNGVGVQSAHAGIHQRKAAADR